MTDIVTDLQSWYQGNCDGDWEHEFGLRIETLDNPGWSVEIDLADTPQEGVQFPAVKIDRSEQDWIDCRIADNKFRGVGGATNFAQIIRTFLDWVDTTQA